MHVVQGHRSGTAVPCGDNISWQGKEDGLVHEVTTQEDAKAASVTVTVIFLLCMMVLNGGNIIQEGGMVQAEREVNHAGVLCTDAQFLTK